MFLFEFILFSAAARSTPSVSLLEKIHKKCYGRNERMTRDKYMQNLLLLISSFLCARDRGVAHMKLRVSIKRKIYFCIRILHC